MTLSRTFVDAEDVVLAWLKATSVATLVTVGGKVHCFQAMPKSAPLPAVVLSRVGGAPQLSDVPVDEARISFDVWAANRPQCKNIKLTLIDEIESLCYDAPFIGAGGCIQTATTQSDFWAPDPKDDTPRYVIDAVFYVQAVS